MRGRASRICSEDSIKRCSRLASFLSSGAGSITRSLVSGAKRKRQSREGRPLAVLAAVLAVAVLAVAVLAVVEEEIWRQVLIAGQR